MKWCPSPGCNYAVKVDILEKHGRSVTCKCGHTFCFQCSGNAHDPLWCEMLAKWIKKNRDDSETSNWISVNTKECPKCKANIQKDGGCNHMVCKNKACKMQFCWVCLGAWTGHDPYRCNRFNEDDAKGARENQEKSRGNLTRYLFYFNRYANHNNSLMLENDFKDRVRQKMEETSWIEVQFLKEAFDTLCRCRRTLMLTYVFAFYLKKVTTDSEVEIFETNQEDLQASTEKLSAIFEREVFNTEGEVPHLSEIKQKVSCFKIKIIFYICAHMNVSLY